MVVWWLCWHRTILIRHITQKQYSQFPPMHDFGKPWWGVAYAWFRETVMRRGLCTLYDQSPSALRFGNPVARDLHVLIGRTLAGSTRAVQSCLCSLRHVNVARGFLQHLARACSEQSRSTTVLPINHVIQMPQCLSGFVNHDYCTYIGQVHDWCSPWQAKPLYHYMEAALGWCQKWLSVGTVI